MVMGLTGGIACGKSTVGRFFADLGWRRLDADEIVREMLRADTETISLIWERFGPSVIAPDASVDRHRLAGIVFPDPDRLRQLEEIIHPRVRMRWKAAVQGAPDARWVVEIPLLFEKGLEKEVDFSVCVACGEAVQAQRLALRGLSPQEVSQRIARQLPLARKIERADFVITNNGSLAFLRDQVNRLAALLARPAA